MQEQPKHVACLYVQLVFPISTDGNEHLRLGALFAVQWRYSALLHDMPCDQEWQA